MKRKKPVIITERKPSPSQMHQFAFHRTVKDLGTPELGYRAEQNAQEISKISHTIASATAVLKDARTELSRLSRERDVMDGLVEGRR